MSQTKPASFSTPLRASSRQIINDAKCPTPPTSQLALKGVMNDELGEHTWQFPPNRIAQMLSTKSRKSPLAFAEIDTLAAYDCDIDSLSRALDVACQSFVPEPWPANLVGERSHYTYIEGYLNGCVRSCHDALDSCNFKVKKGKRWYSDLNFITYDKETGDGIDGASPLKPDLSGGKKLSNGTKLYWSPSDGSPPILLPIEVKQVWKDLVIQAATYARALFSASPSRQFALVLGVEHARKELRFMIFHRGGFPLHFSRIFASMPRVLSVGHEILTTAPARFSGVGLCVGSLVMSTLKRILRCFATNLTSRPRRPTILIGRAGAST